MRRGAIRVSAIVAALLLAVTLVAGPDAASAWQGAAGRTVELDVRVWQHVRDPLRIHVSARPVGGGWDTLGTVRLPLDDGFSRGRVHRYGDIAVAGVELRVWQHIGNPLSIFISTRGAHDDWAAERTFRLRLDGRSRSGAYRYGDTSVSVPNPPPRVTVSPGGEKVPRLATLTIAFRDPPPEGDGRELVSIEPRIEGSFAWIDERTLLFQPAYPGWEIGQHYRLSVDAGAAGLREDHEHAFTAEGAPEVTHVIPGDGDVEVPVEAQILVQFARSAVPLTVLQEGSGAALLDFSPPLAGRGEWLNTSLYRFVPSELQPGTTYSVRIPAGLIPAADRELASDFTWSFSTIRPAVTSFEPHDGATFVEPDTRVWVTFNQPMDRASIQAGLVLREAEGGSVAGSFTWSRGATEAVVAITPHVPLKLNTKYEVIAPAGLRSPNGGVTHSERVARFTTVAPPRVTATSPTDGETSANCCAISVDFNNPMDDDSFEGRISVNGTVLGDPSFAVRSRSLIAWNVLEFSTEYTVRITEGVRDRGGRPLPAYEFSFVTQPPPPPRPPSPTLKLTYSSAFQAWPAAAEPTLRYGAGDVAEVRFKLYRLSDMEAETLLRRDFALGTDWGSPYYAFTRPASEPIREWTEAIPAEGHEASTPLGGGELLPPGHYLVAADAEEVLYTEKLVFSVVDTTIFTKLAHDELLVWSVDYETGEPLTGVEVRAGSAGDPDRPNYSQAESVVTDTDGLARFAIPSTRDQGWRPYQDYLVRINDGGRNGVALTWWDGASAPDDLDVPIAASFPATRAHLYTERPIYRPGETVFYKGVVRAEDDGAYALPDPGPAFRLDIQGHSPSRIVRPGALGTISGEFVLRADASPVRIGSA